MAIFLLSVGLMSIIMMAMAVGVIFSNKELKGSCGGPDQCACEKAGRPKACEQADRLNQLVDSLQSQES
jgi:hypothetical protein